MMAISVLSASLAAELSGAQLALLFAAAVGPQFLGHVIFEGTLPERRPFEVLFDFLCRRRVSHVLFFCCAVFRDYPVLPCDEHILLVWLQPATQAGDLQRSQTMERH